MTMRLPRMVGIALLAVTLAGPARADAVQDRVTDTLVDQGYEIVLVQNTWLGRLRIVAESDEYRREIVLNPHTGEVLRDYSSVLVAADARDGNGFETDRPSRNTDDSARITAAGDDAALSAGEAVEDSVAVPEEP